MLLFFILFILAYLVGSIPNALWIGKMFKNIDVREFGSGNVGATNATRVLGWKLGVMVLIFDAFKGMIFIIIARILGLEDIYVVLIGLAAILGHSYSIYLKFKGGKAVATSLGVMLVLIPKVVMILIIVFLLIVIISGYVSLASISVAGLLPILSYIMYNNIIALLSLVVGMLGIWRHKSNIKNLLEGKKGYKCYIWEYNEQYRKEIRESRENSNFLKGFKLNESIEIVDDFIDTINKENIDIILLATPTQFLRNIVVKLKGNINKNTILVNVAKGIEISSSLTISQMINEVLGEGEYKYVLLAGPTHAEEVINDMPSAISAVSNDEEAAKIVQNVFSIGHTLRVYTGTDLIGSELGGAIKNCLAICAGICDGLGYGDNTKAALLTRGMNEMVVIGKALGANPQTFLGLTGIGDMIVTCTSKHSRNRYFGEEIGKGKKVDEIINEMKMVAEGLPTSKALYNIIQKYSLRAPVFTELYALLYENNNVKDLLPTFMSRELKSEF